ncbi:unnamed protein product [Candidula unifasciata]|uniref:Palmitoyltransferase n=1 Tax=Candidula unifasciata TaxID=100452 RepID=A0A8S3YQ83_9EUPU|nr:unnamed protein product [Candidula unifasciata]
MEDSNLFFTDTSPESLEMDRDDKPPFRQPQLESLSHKLQAHYKRRFGSSKVEVPPNPLPPELFGRIALPLFLLTVFSSLKLTLFDIIPLLYAGQDGAVFLQRCLCCFLFMEIMINWLGIRYVDSSYQKYIKTDANFPSAEQNFANEKMYLEKEAESVNQWMIEQNEQVNSRSIADLISVSENSKVNLLLQQEKKNRPETHLDIINLMTPKPVIKRIGKTVTESYPYWSWVPCYACRRTRPPRCHHCPLCKTCILKRNHHCFFAGSCIGYRNHRFFIVFLFWALIGCVYATLHVITYISLELWSQMSYSDIFFPVAVIRWIFGYLSFHTLLLMITVTFLIMFIFITTGYLFSEFRNISQGLTTFEKLCLKRSLEIRDTRRLNQKIRAIFGRYWLLNFVFPTHFFLKPEEDPIYWPHIQIIKH